MIGERFGRLVVLEEGPRTKHRKRTWICLCECGKRTKCSTGDLRGGNSKSCGCLQRDKAREYCFANHPKIVEGVLSSQHYLYHTWDGMKKRCYRKEATCYENYGGRGIKVCERWRKSFSNFVEDMGPRPDGHTLDRIDNNGDYSPDNCKWSTAEEQMSNRGGY